MKYHIVILMVAIGLSACSTNPAEDSEDRYQSMREQKAEETEELQDEIPDWFLKTPQSQAGIYGVGTAMSSDLQTALDNAKSNAVINIAETYKQEASALTKGYRSSNPASGSVTGNYTRAFEQFVDKADVSGIEVINHKILEDNGMHRIFVLAFLPYDDMNQVKSKRLEQESNASSIEKAAAAQAELERRIGVTQTPVEE
jgi:hypothetical protein